MIGDENPDYEQALKLLEQRQQQMQQPQGPMAQSGGSFSSALDTLNKFQGRQQQQAAPMRQMPADEAPPKEDNAKTYWAMALSLLGGGRDLGSVLQNSADSYNKRLAAWEARNSPDAKLDRQMKLAQLEQMDRAPQREQFEQATRLAGIEQADRSQATQQQQFALSQEQQLFMRKADEVFERAKLAAQNKHADDSQANAQAHSEKLAFYAQHGMDERQANELENQRNMQNQRIEAENARNEADNVTRLGVAAMAAQGKRPAAIPGTHITDQSRYDSLLPGQREKADEVAMSAVQLDQHFKQLQQLVLQPRSSGNQNAFNQLRSELVGDINRAASAGVVNGQEFLRQVENLADYTSTTDAIGKLQQMKGPLATLEVLRQQNPTLNALATMQKLHADAFNAKSRIYGFELGDSIGQPVAGAGGGGGMAQGGPPPQQAAAAPQAPQFDVTKLPGKVQLLGPTQKAEAAPAPTPAPMTPAQDEMATPPLAGDVRSTMPQQLPPMRDEAGHVKQPMSYREMEELIAKHWRPLNG